VPTRPERGPVDMAARGAGVGFLAGTLTSTAGLSVKTVTRPPRRSSLVVIAAPSGSPA